MTGSAVTVLHFDGSNQSAPPVAAINTAFQNAKALFPGNVIVTTPNSGDTIEDTTGALTGVWSTTGGGVMTGTNAVPAFQGVGACIGWTTGGIVQGTKGPRKLRGRTFIVPISTGCADSDGTILPSSLTLLDTLAASLQAAGPLAIWHRPTTAGGSNGNSYGVLSHRVRDKVAVLRSRRD